LNKKKPYIPGGNKEQQKKEILREKGGPSRNGGRV